jgi:gamma-glutamyl-gamma-aminobutyraldehyde dehydrogenase/4-guanidinobutyraldehyde dehydrogenase/NAD-dependent aldehyde dehydrogenase
MSSMTLDLPNSYTGWMEIAGGTTMPCDAFVDGSQVPASSGATFEDRSARDGSVLANVAFCNEVDVNRAVAAARTAFEDGRWSRVHPRHRKKVLLAFARLIRENAAELAVLETLDVGKPITEAVKVDVGGAAMCIEYFAEAADKLMGEVAPMGAEILATVTREPVGVVGCVVPWNYPMLITSWKLGPALVTGNSVVLKPAEQSPLTAIRLAELATQAGLPDGVLNVIPGDGPTTGRLLGLHPDVDKLAFTGSTEVGRLFLSYAGQSNMKMVSLECGGKSPHIVLADAPDLQVAADAVAWGIFYNQGESCSAGSRLLVDRSVKDEVVARVVALARTLVVGDPLDPATQVGAVIDGVQQGRILSYIDGATAAGAEVLIGGSALRQETGGNYMAPTVVDSVTPSMAIAREEVFGPVLAVLDVDGPDEALTVANDTMYGLAAAVWTRDISTAHRMASRLKAGTVWVNTYDATDVALPFGGFKQSGFGRDKSLHAIDGYTQLKTTWVDFSR